MENKNAGPKPAGEKPSQRALVHNWIKDQAQEMARALPHHLSAERFVRVVLTAVSQNPDLLLCTKESLLLSLMRAAQLGLEPDGLLGQGYLIPYKNKGVHEAQFQPGYQGLIELAHRSGKVAAVNARAVFEKDTFDYYYGLEEDHLKHVPADTDRGALTHAYCVVRLKGGGVQFSVLSKEKIERDHRGRSRAKDAGPWKSDYEAMCLKTAVRVALKMAPKSIEMARAVALDERAELGLPIDLSPDEWQLLKDRRIEPTTLGSVVGTGAAVEVEDDAPAGPSVPQPAQRETVGAPAVGPTTKGVERDAKGREVLERDEFGPTVVAKPKAAPPVKAAPAPPQETPAEEYDREVEEAASLFTDREPGSDD